MPSPHDLSTEDGAVLTAAQDHGRIEARVFERGDFSEEGFLLYGRLERLCARGLLRFVSWSGDPFHGDGDVEAVFAPARAIAA
jgi:hypothetical protein